HHCDHYFPREARTNQALFSELMSAGGSKSATIVDFAGRRRTFGCRRLSRLCLTLAPMIGRVSAGPFQKRWLAEPGGMDGLRHMERGPGSVGPGFLIIRNDCIGYCCIS